MITTALLLLLSACYAVAQEEKQAAPPPPPPVSNVVAFAAAQNVLYDINDVGLLRALAPLKLTQEQIDKILPVMKAIALDGEKRRREDADALRGLAADLRTAKAGALEKGGEGVSDELWDRLAKTTQAIDARLATARKNALGRMLPVVKETFTTAQKDDVEARSEKVFGGKRIPPEYKNNPSKAPKEVVQDLALVAFIERVLLNDRAIEVMSHLKPAPAAAAPAPTP